jgi:hypothetical protein
VSAQPPSDPPQAHRALVRLLVRAARLRLVLLFARALLALSPWAALAVLLVAVLDRLVWLGPFAAPLAAGAGVVWLGAALLVVLRDAIRRRGRDAACLASAEMIDERLHLQDRLSSAVAALSDPRPPSGPAAAAVRDDVIEAGLEAAADVRLRRVFRLRPPRRALATPALLLAALLVATVVEPADLFGRRRAAAERLRRRRAVRRSARLVRKEAAELRRVARALQPGESRELLKQLDELVRQLEENPLERREALLELSRLQRRLEAERQRLADVASAQSAALEEKLAQTGDLQKALESGDVAQAAAEAARLARSLPSLDADKRARAAAELEKLAQALQSNPQLAQKLAQAAQALQNMSSAQAQQALQALQQNLQACQNAQQCLAATQQALGQIAMMKQALGSPNLAQLQPGQNPVFMPGQNAGQPGDQPGAFVPAGGVPAVGAVPGTGGIGPDQTSRAAEKETPPVPMAVRTKLQGGEAVGLLSFRSAPGDPGQVRELQQVLEAAGPEPGGRAPAEQPLPRAYRDTVRRYFDSLRPTAPAKPGPGRSTE